MPVQHQWASIAAWNDEQHVLENRELYRRKFTAVLDILGDCLDVQQPQAAFYLWAGTAIDDREFAQRLFAEQNVTVLPGQYLARATSQGNPGANRVRMALVADFDECVEAARRIRQFVASL
jgi:N-succinyldiaminopimelate aminotransferase